MNGQKTIQGGENTKLSFKETIQAAKTFPEFRNGVVAALIGIAAVAVSILFTSYNVKMIVSIIGMFTGYSGFDQISKVIAGIQNAPVDENKESNNDTGTNSSNNE